jgi:hypothetical protein
MEAQMQRLMQFVTVILLGVIAAALVNSQGQSQIGRPLSQLSVPSLGLPTQTPPPQPGTTFPLRVFVSGLGLDTNPCTSTQPCRSFQQAYNTAAPNGEIYVLDPQGYGPLTITHGISIQGHGFAGITQTSNPGAAITISVTTSDPVTLNGLLIDGAGTGQYGIHITSGTPVQILNSVVRHFQVGIDYASNIDRSTLLIQDTIASDNSAIGIDINPQANAFTSAILNRITANNNQFGVSAYGGLTTIANSVISNNTNTGVNTQGAPIGNVALAKTVISGNKTGVAVGGGITAAFSYGDNYIADLILPQPSTLVLIPMQ